MKKWEEKAIPELGGQSPEQYFASMDAIDSILQQIDAFEEMDCGIPTGFVNHIETIGDSISDEVLKLLENIAYKKIKPWTHTKKQFCV